MWTLTYLERARQIIEDNRYMVLATADRNSVPWASPVFFVHDNRYNFYFLSAIDSRHSENIISNPSVSMAIFDSTTPVGMTNGVQISGKANLVEGNVLKDVIDMYCNRLFPNSEIPSESRYRIEDYSQPSEFRFFKIGIVEAYVTGEERRVKVDLTKDLSV